MSNPEMPQEHIPSLETVTDAYSEVLEYNRKHTGFGAAFGKTIRAVIETETADDNSETSENNFNDTFNKKMEEATTEGDMYGELQSVMHEDTFMRIGIRLDSLENHISKTDGERMSSSTLTPRIENTELYTDFLSQLNSAEVQNDEENLALITDVVSTLQKTVKMCYGRAAGDIPSEERDALLQRGEDALRTFSQVDEAYKELGLDNPELYQRYLEEGTTGYLDDQWERYQKAKTYHNAYKSLENYERYWGRGVLKEYIFAKSYGYLVPPEEQGFGPSHWHNDSDKEELTQMWNRFIDLIRSTYADPAKKSFGDELLDAARNNLEQARSDWKSQKSEGKVPEDYGKGFDEVFETTAQKLDVLATPNE
jgi:hypothetical protein